MASALLLLPDLLLVLLGLLIQRRRLMADSFWGGLEKLIFFILFPALLFVSTMKLPLDLGAMAPLLQISLLSSALGIALGYAVRRLVPMDDLDFASGVQCAFRCNSYLGLALANRLGGDAGLALMALLVGVNIPLFNVAAVWGLARHGSGNVFKEILRNPLVSTTVLGLLCNLAGLRLPDVLAQALGRLGNASIALALLNVGAGLRWSGMDRGHGALSWWLAVKLLGMPFLAWLFGRWLGLPALQQQVAVAFAALPAAPGACVLAARMGGNGAIAAFLVSAGTVASLLTLPLWLTVVS